MFVMVKSNNCKNEYLYFLLLGEEIRRIWRIHEAARQGRAGARALPAGWHGLPADGVLQDLRARRGDGRGRLRPARLHRGAPQPARARYAA